MSLRFSTMRNCILIAFAAVVLLAAATHEPWRDEADCWLAARDLSPSGLFGWTRYVGSPAAWYLMLMPLAKSGLPYQSMVYLNAAVAIAAAWLLLRSRLPMPLVALSLFSYYLCYEYAAIARNYAILTLSLFLVAGAYGDRIDHPLRYAASVFLLFNTTAHGAMLAVVLGVMFVFESRRGRTLIVLGFAAALWQLWPPSNGQRSALFAPEFPGAPLDILGRAVAVPLGARVLEPLWIVGNAVVVSICAVYLSRRPRVLTIFLGGVAALMYVFVFKWCAPERHAGLIYLWLLFCLWIADLRDTRWVTLALCAALIPAVVNTAVAVGREVSTQYSHAKQMGLYMRRHGLDGVVATSNIAQSVLPYLNCRQAWSVNNARMQSYNLWDTTYQMNWEINNPWMVWERVRRDFPDSKPPLVWDYPLGHPEAFGYRLGYATAGSVGPSGERFWLYVAAE